MGYANLQQQVKEILQKEDDLQEIVQLVGKDSLSEDQKCTLEVAKVIREDFLQQNGFPAHDKRCPLEKTLGMMPCIVEWHDLSQTILEESGSGDDRIKFGELHTGEIKAQFKMLTDMKFEDDWEHIE